MTAPEDYPTWLDGLAEHLADVGFGTYRADGAYPDELEGWALFLERTPPNPGLAITLTGYGGGRPDHGREPRVQIKVRGDADPRTSRRQAEAIHDYLHELVGGVALPDGTWLVRAPGINGGAVPLGIDDNHRFTHVTNHETTTSPRLVPARKDTP